MTDVGELVDRVGVRLHPTRDDTAVLPVSPAVVHEGEILVSPMMLAADIASGIRLHDLDVTTVLTTSFSFRRASTAIAPNTAAITAVSTRLFTAHRRVVDRTEFRDDSNELVATGRISFKVRHHSGPDAPIHRDVLSKYRSARTHPIDEPLIDAAGIETVDPATGRVTLRAGKALRRDGGIVQGSFVTLLGEASALALAEHSYQQPGVVVALDVEFLAAIGADDVATEARWLAAAGESDIEVVIRSDSSSSALAAFVIRVARVTSKKV